MTLRGQTTNADNVIIAFPPPSPSSSSPRPSSSSSSTTTSSLGRLSVSTSAQAAADALAATLSISDSTLTSKPNGDPSSSSSSSSKPASPLDFSRPSNARRRASGPALTFSNLSSSAGVGSSGNSSTATSIGTSPSFFGRSIGNSTAASSVSSNDLDAPTSFVALRSSSYGGMKGSGGTTMGPDRGATPMMRSSSSSTTSASASALARTTSQSLTATGAANTPATSEAASRMGSPAEPGKAGRVGGPYARRPTVSRSASSDDVDVSPLMRRTSNTGEPLMDDWWVDGEWNGGVAAKASNESSAGDNVGSGANKAEDATAGTIEASGVVTTTVRPKPAPRANSHEGHNAVLTSPASSAQRSADKGGGDGAPTIDTPPAIGAEGASDAEVLSPPAPSTLGDAFESYRATPDPYAPMTPVTATATAAAAAPAQVPRGPAMVGHAAMAPSPHYATPHHPAPQLYAYPRAAVPGFVQDPMAAGTVPIPGAAAAATPMQYAYGMPPMLVPAGGPGPGPGPGPVPHSHAPSSWAWQTPPPPLPPPHAHGAFPPGGAHSRTPSLQHMDPMDPTMYAGHGHHDRAANAAPRDAASPVPMNPMMGPWSSTPVHLHHQYTHGGPPAGHHPHPHHPLAPAMRPTASGPGGAPAMQHMTYPPPEASPYYAAATPLHGPLPPPPQGYAGPVPAPAHYDGFGTHSRQSSFGSQHSRAPSHGSSFGGGPASPFAAAYGFSPGGGHQRQGSSHHGALRMGRAYHSPAPSTSSVNLQRLSISSNGGAMHPRSGHTSMPSTSSSSVMTSASTSASVSAAPSVSSSRSPLLEEFRYRSSKGGRKFELADIKGALVEFSTDQHGSRFAQEKLDSASEEERQACLDEVLPSIRTLMADVFGNYVVQKLFEHGTPRQRASLVDQMAGHVLELSLGTYGCRVVQKALDHVEASQQLALAQELRHHVLQCVRDQNANHVVQKMIEKVEDKEAIGFVPKAFEGRVAELAAHCYSCRVLQRIFEHCPGDQSRGLMQEMQREVVGLCQDQYGNYVVQWVLQKGRREDRQSVVEKVKGRVLTLSRHKFASNVVEEVLRAAEEEDRRILIEEILAEMPVEGSQASSISTSKAAVAVKNATATATATSTAASPPTCGAHLLMLDQYGNYVLQRCIQVAEPSQRERLIAAVRPQLARARRNGAAGAGGAGGGHAKHLAAIEKLVGRTTGMEGKEREEGAE